MLSSTSLSNPGGQAGPFVPPTRCRSFVHQRFLRPVFPICCAFLAATLHAAEPEIRVAKIWDGAPHNAFTDLARFQGQWFCVFRESEAHVGGDGKIRIIVSKDGEQWKSAALVSEEGVDLRDPKLCITPDGRLMLTMGGSIYRGGNTALGRRPRVAFSTNGNEWSDPRVVLGEGDWLWRVTWHAGTAYGVSYASEKDGAWQLTLYRSNNGVAWERVTPLAVPDRPNETTLRFLADGSALALVRREAGDKHGWLGRAKPPYVEWKWQSVGRFIGGPEMLVLPDGRLLAAGRDLAAAGPKTALGFLVDGVWKIDRSLPSGGDTGYPGMVWYEGVVWISYYSSHEGKSAIYLAKLPLDNSSP